MHADRDTTSKLRHQAVDRLEEALTQAPGAVSVWLLAQIDALLSEIPFRMATLRSIERVREPTSSRLLTAEEAATLLNVPVRWIRRHAKTLPHRRMGKYVRFDEQALLRWAENRQR